VTGRRSGWGRFGLRLVIWAVAFAWLAILVPMSAMAAPYAAMVMDARTGKVLHARNADTRLHPASLTKMMTLYIAFEAVQNGELSMDTMVTVSRNAAAEPPSKLGLRPGQKIKLRYLVRAAAVKSANDAATAIGPFVHGARHDHSWASRDLRLSYVLQPMVAKNRRRRCAHSDPYQQPLVVQLPWGGRHQNRLHAGRGL